MKDVKEPESGTVMFVTFLALPFTVAWAAWVGLTVWGMAGLTALFGVSPTFANFVGIRAMLALFGSWKASGDDLITVTLLAFFYPALILAVTWMVIR